MGLFATLGILAGSALTASVVDALPQNHTDAQVNAAVDAGTFQNPSANVRPRFRYWVPDASVDNETLAVDVAGAKHVGAGGVEVVGYYLYGGSGLLGDSTPTDWTIYGWGTPAWKGAFRTLLQAHESNDLIMDFALGPNQGQGVPAPEDSKGLAWDLFPFNISVPAGGSFDGLLPGWGMGILHAVTTGLVTNSQNITVPPGPPRSYHDTGTAPSLPGDEPLSRTQLTLASDSLQDVTSQVSTDGHLNITFPKNVNGLEYYIFATYLIHSDYRAQQGPLGMEGPETPPPSWRSNGSWAVDHYSVAGAQTVTNYWQQYLLDAETRKLLEAVGNYGWEDSIEIQSNIQWTQDFTKRFTTDHGYDLTKYLPILFHQNKLEFFGDYIDWWITDEPDSGNGHIADYRKTVGNLYGEYLETLNQWHHDYLGVQFSAQVAYNLPMDMQQNVPNVDAPECESLGFNHLIDAYRQYAGPANLAGKRIISTECGATAEMAYRQFLHELMWDVKRSFAGGVVQFVFHGYPFSGSYGNTTWPGFTTFVYYFSEMHGPRQPAWDYYKNSGIDFTARNSFIFQSGIPKMDVAFYQKITSYAVVANNYMSTDLEEAVNLSSLSVSTPENFHLPEAYVRNGVLGPNRQAFKALVVRANDSMTVDGVAGIAKYAHAGLPVIFSGGLPSYLASYNASGSRHVHNTLRSLTSLKNVHVVPYAGLASTISSLGIKPLTAVKANRTWYTYWRRDDTKGMDYVFVYNDAAGKDLGDAYSEGIIEFASIGTPAFYDAWTGQHFCVKNVSRSHCSTVMPLHLAGNQSVIIAFADRGAHAGCQFSAVDDPSVPMPAPASAPYSLSNWTLIAEHWDPPNNLADNTPDATVKHNTTHLLANGLVPWLSIPGLRNVSGRGFYSTAFSWPPSEGNASTLGAYIDFGTIAHTIEVRINGRLLAPLDTTWAKADISDLLANGENAVEAVVTTPLWNVLSTVWAQIETSGMRPFFPGSWLPLQEYGLVQPVRVVPFAKGGL